MGVLNFLPATLVRSSDHCPYLDSFALERYLGESEEADNDFTERLVEWRQEVRRGLNPGAAFSLSRQIRTYIHVDAEDFAAALARSGQGASRAARTSLRWHLRRFIRNAQSTIWETELRAQGIFACWSQFCDEREIREGLAAYYMGTDVRDLSGWQALSPKERGKLLDGRMRECEIGRDRLAELSGVSRRQLCSILAGTVKHPRFQNVAALIGALRRESFRKDRLNRYRGARANDRAMRPACNGADRKL